MKRKLAWLAGIVIVIGAGLMLGKDWIADRIVDETMNREVGVDFTKTMPDGINVYLCGTGSPLPDMDHAGPCVGVVAGKDAFIFDVGSGSIRKLLRMGYPIERLQGTFITHLHSDHIDGMGELLVQAWVGGSRTTPMPVYGPEGIDKVMGGFLQAYDIDRGYRIAHHGPQVARPEGFGAVTHVVSTVPGAVVYEANGVRITATTVDHGPVKPAFGYRLDYKGRSITISGDQAFSPSFVALSKGTDVMFHEALNRKLVARMHDKLAERGHADLAKVFGDIQGYHSSPEDAAKAAKQAGAKALVLYHLIPPLPSRLAEPMFVGDAPKVYDGPIKVGHDGMRITLPAGSNDIRFD